MRNPRRIVAALVAALALSTPTVSHAGKGYGTQFWAATTFVAPLSERSATGVQDALKASSEMGYQFGVEFRSGFLGVALDYLHATPKFKSNTVGVLGTADFNPISATLQLHLPLPLLDLYAGPTVSYVNWGDLEVSGTSVKQKVDAKLGYGFSVGADLPLGHTLALTSGARWLKLDAGGAAALSTVAVDPLITHLGLALRF